MNSERPADEQILANQMRIAREKASRLLTDRFPRIDPQRFTEYNLARTQSNLAKVAEFKQSKNIDEEPRDGMVAEAFLFDMIGSNEWFGRGVSIQRTSEYDDFFNHIDALASLHADDPTKMLTGFLGLSFDVTISHEGVIEKLNRIHDSVKKGQLGQVTYAEIGTFRGQLGSVPHGVLYIDEQNFIDSIKKWSRSRPGAKDDTSSRELRTHQLQIELLAQLSLQMHAFSKIGKSTHNGILTAMENTINTRLLERTQALDMDKSRVLKILKEAPSLKIMRSRLQSYSSSMRAT